jgi:hypothetical protein
VTLLAPHNPYSLIPNPCSLFPGAPCLDFETWETSILPSSVPHSSRFYRDEWESTTLDPNHIQKEAAA